MSNYLTESEQRVLHKLDLILTKIKDLEAEIKTLKDGDRPAPTRIPLKEFCTERNISRPTAYAWHERGLIQMERVGGRQYINTKSITVAPKRYQRNA